uniref:Lycosin 4k 4ah Trochosin 2i n=1 Tax=Trochosa ruricola TaxID=330967 RepID=A0A8D7ZT78_9ARAC|nr:Lycosin 4k 4ah Trochosin 2i precursor [Trochosa ruricola]
MNYTIIAFFLLVALTCSTARSIDASEETAQEIREETPSSNEDAPFTLSANEAEEARNRLADLLAILKAVAVKASGREETFSANEDEEARNRLADFLATLKAIAAKVSGREETFSANEDEEARINWANLIAKLKVIAAKAGGREESLSANEDEEAQNK